MLLTSEYILNGLGDTTWELHPWADSCTNEVRRGDNVRGVRVPDIAPQELLDFDESAGHGLADDDSNVIPPFSMTAGEFMEVYEDRVAFWDSVVTCFFIDTAPRITEYIRALYRMIKPGGYWINLGPLLWHWAPSLPGNPAHSVGSQLDRRNLESVELPFDYVEAAIVAAGFEMLNVEWRNVHYTHNVRSMLSSQYKVVFFTARKPAGA
mmetsp:Transcript_37806/g.118437  ORF Transcript_37806/g.118437 Transcript_37806/m.118437 type:complete len:209 (-) Transcript_37806:126-752(-)